jgi:ubiquinol-cytochrome c reductase cytochrome c subunit
MKYFALLAAMVTLATPAWTQAAPAADAARGKEIFMRDACYTCHGTTGASTSFVGPKLAHAGLTAAQILRQLRHPQAQMPAYTEKVLPDSDVADIAAYIQTLQQGPTPTGKDIPLLNR